MSSSFSSHWKTILRWPVSNGAGGSRLLGAGAPGSASMRGRAQAMAITTTTMIRLANRDPNNTISLNDAIEHVAAAAKLPEDGIPAIEVRLRGVGDEELAPAGIRPGERHAERPSHVSMRIELVTNGIPRSAVSVASRVASLDHEVRHDAMKQLSVEKVPARERHEIVH